MWIRWFAFATNENINGIGNSWRISSTKFNRTTGSPLTIHVVEADWIHYCYKFWRIPRSGSKKL